MKLITNTMRRLIMPLALASFASHAQTPEAMCATMMPAEKLQTDRKSTRLNSSHLDLSRMPSSA